MWSYDSKLSAKGHRQDGITLLNVEDSCEEFVGKLAVQPFNKWLKDSKTGFFLI